MTDRAEKLKRLANSMGYDSPDQYLNTQNTGSDTMGICTKPKCNSTRPVDPYETAGKCDSCGENSVESGLSLGGLTNNDD